MAIKVIAQRRVLKIGKNPGVNKFVMLKISNKFGNLFGLH